MSNDNAAAAAQTTTTTTQAFNRPAAEKRIGGMEVTVWRKEPQGEAKYPSYTTRVRHDYYDKKTKEWKPVTYATFEENAMLITLRQWAAMQELELRSADRAAARAAAPAPA